jgi:hypothetical protein
MTDARDRISGPGPEGEPDDPDSQTFFEDEGGVRDRAGDSPRDATSPNAGYTGGLAEGTESAAGMRQIVVDEATDRRARGAADEPPANLAQQDQ